MQPTTKLYVQLEPDQAGKILLQSIQTSLHDAHRLVPTNSLHLTVIHIGLVSKLLESIKPHTHMSDSKILQSLDVLVSKLYEAIAAINFKTCTLQPDGYDFFGAQRTTYVVRFKKTLLLENFYTACLKELEYFLSEIGISNPKTFMADDTNLKYAISLEPHVAVAQSYHGEGSNHALRPIEFSLMPLIY